jgi:hypothetical protein
VLASCDFFGGNDTTAPTVTAVTPEAGAEIWLHDPITVTFSEAVDPDTVNTTTVVVTAEDGTAIAATPTPADDGKTLVVKLAADAAFIGGARLTLAGIADDAGNKVADTTVAWTVPAWQRAALGGSTPAVAVGDRDQVLVAWTIGPLGGRRILVSELGAAGSIPLGGQLGASDASQPSITFDAQDRPILVWSESPALRAARWDGVSWMTLDSPGDGSYPATARAPGGDPVLALVSSLGFGGTGQVRVYRLVDTAWKQVASDIVVAGSLAAPPALAMMEGDAPVVAFAETGTGIRESPPQLHVFRLGAAVLQTSLPIGLPGNNATMTAGVTNRVAVAAHGGAVTVAYDTFSGFSFGVHVVRIEGQVVKPLGGELDVDSPANASTPMLAIDADGAPVVAWRELIESNWRGFFARWDGAKWHTVGGGAWNNDPSHSLADPAMALARGRAPIIAWAGPSVGNDDAKETALHVARWNGPAAPRWGLPARVSLNGCAFDGTQATLSATGCFAIAAGRATPHAGLLPFDIVSELWSDGARKRRWIALADGSMMTAPPNGAWTAPVGTMMLKEFAIETTPGDPRTRRVMETRFLVLTETSTGTPAWQGFSFRWRTDGSDADLLPDVASTVDWQLDNGNIHTHSYPSRQQCARCHHASNGPLLGVRTGQLARRFDYDGVVGDQLDTLAHVGAIAPPTEARAFASPQDDTLPLEDRMRGYLAANCSHCHNPGGERPTRDFRWETPLADTKLCGPDSEIVQGHPEQSVLFARISTRVNGMPPLATLQTDPLAIDVIGRWITAEVNCQ